MSTKFLNIILSYILLWSGSMHSPFFYLQNCLILFVGSGKFKFNSQPFLSLIDKYFLKTGIFLFNKGKRLFKKCKHYIVIVFSFFFNWLYVCTEYSITVRVDSDYYAAGVPPTCSVRRSNGPSFTAVRQEQVMNSPQAEFFSFLSDAQQYMFTFYLILFSTQYNFKFAIQSQKIHLFTTNHRSFLHTNYAALPIVF